MHRFRPHQSARKETMTAPSAQPIRNVKVTRPVLPAADSVSQVEWVELNLRQVESGNGFKDSMTDPLKAKEPS